jgi:hypothetical protein
LHGNEFAANIVFMPIEQLLKQKNTKRFLAGLKTSSKRIVKKAVFQAVRDIIMYKISKIISIRIKKIYVKA